MKKMNLRLLFLSSILGGSMFAQTARVQVIHNSADAAADSVDIWLGTTKLIDNFKFRTASPFIDAPAGTLINIGVAPATSTNSSQAIANFPLTLTANQKYVVVANGIVSSSGYNPSPAFDLDIYAMGREKAANAGKTDVLVVHGSTDAPHVDVKVPGVGTIINNLAYGTFNPYLELATANYTLNITDSTGNTVVASYKAPLQTLGLQDSALVVVASGFLNPANNSNQDEFGLWVALPKGGNLIPLPTSKARVQVIHNCADAAADTVDVYLGTTQLINDFAFRTASAFIDAPAETAQIIGVAAKNSTSSSQSIATFPITLAADSTYVVVANGIVSTTGYSPSPAFDLDIYASGREQSKVTGKTDVLVAHGSTDAPTVDVEAGAATIVNNLAYGAFNPYLELTTANYTLNVTDQSGATVVASYKAPLQTLGLVNKAIVVVASGFLNPANNSNGSAFGLWAALPTGGALVQLPSSKARVQVIHNCADAAADTVDVYLGTTQLINDFAFRTASAFIDAPAETAQIIGVAAKNSTSSSQSIATFPVTLAADSTYIVVANGIVSATGYSPSPAFDLDIFASGRETASNSSNTDILVLHGSTDAPIVDIKSGSATLVNDIAYGSFAGYLSVPTANLPIDVANQAGTTILASYSAPLSTLGLQGKAISVLASGFLTPSNNSNGKAFGLWVALNTGGNLIPLPLSTSIVENGFVNSINVFPNPANEFVQMNFELTNTSNVSIQLFDVLGKELYSENLGQLAPGAFTTAVDVLNLNSGIYNLSIVTNNVRKNMKLSIVK